MTSMKKVLLAMLGVAMLALPVSASAGDHHRDGDEARNAHSWHHDSGNHYGWFKHHGPDGWRGRGGYANGWNNGYAQGNYSSAYNQPYVNDHDADDGYYGGYGSGGYGSGSALGYMPGVGMSGARQARMRALYSQLRVAEARGNHGEAKSIWNQIYAMQRSGYRGAAVNPYAYANQGYAPDTAYSPYGGYGYNPNGAYGYNPYGAYGNNSTLGSLMTLAPMFGIR